MLSKYVEFGGWGDFRGDKKNALEQGKQNHPKRAV